jgi:peroxiredoxin
MASLMSHAKEVTDTGARVVLIYPGPTDHLEAHAEDFVAGKSLPDKFLFLVDPDLAFVNDWGLRWDAPGENAYPATVVLDREGKVLFKKVSHTHGDRATAKEILQALGERK